MSSVLGINVVVPVVSQEGVGSSALMTIQCSGQMRMKSSELF